MFKLIAPQHIMHALKFKWMNQHVAQFIMNIFRYPEINAIYAKYKHFYGIEFVKKIIEETNIRFFIDPKDLNHIPEKGPFIIVSNHPYGGVEGLILLHTLFDKRSDIKILANFIFQHIEPIKDFFFAVNPFENIKDIKSIQGLKEALEHLSKGNGLIIFPAGEVSTINIYQKNISDKKWNNSAIKFIRKANVPVIPIHFSGTNSNLFHLLGLIHPMLRTAKIPSELLNKKNKKIHVRIGKPISINEMNKFDDISRLGRYLRARTYALECSEDIKKYYYPVFALSDKNNDIIAAIPNEILEQEIKQLPKETLLFKHKNIHAYLTSANQIPKTIQEIGRLREVTFRAIGEGTNQPVDLDEYDYYYRHLFLWEENEKQIIGAYRLGLGWDIVEHYGTKGFYTRSLFKYKREFQSILKESIELGRSFVIQEYQKNPLSLFLLWKGIFYSVLQFNNCRYLLGPVSISNEYSEVSKSLLVKYILKHHFDITLARYVVPRKRYNPDIAIDTNILVSSVSGLTEVDKLIASIEEKHFKMPILLKKYLQLNGKIIAFNIDPKFSYVIDGLMLLDLYDIPHDILNQFIKDSGTNEIKLFIKSKQVANPIFLKIEH